LGPCPLKTHMKFNILTLIISNWSFFLSFLPIYLDFFISNADKW